MKPDALRNRYTSLTKIGRLTQDQIIIKIQEEYPEYADLPVEEMWNLVKKETPREVKKRTKGMKCEKCGHGNNLTSEWRGYNEDGTNTAKYDFYDIFCMTVTPNSVFRYCFYHVNGDRR